MRPGILILMAVAMLALAGHWLHEPPGHLEYRGCMSHEEYVELWAHPENPLPHTWHEKDRP